jgi:TRAP-type C4-dicarboxylate transport system permease small subunit
MDEGSGGSGLPTDPVGRSLYRIARFLTVCGGLLLLGVALVSAVSITGRTTSIGPIPGDFELVAIGTGVAIFAFLPYCQLVRGNVVVDFFTENASKRFKAFMDAVSGLMYLAIGALLTWRMIYGGIDMYKYNESSITIGFPRWTTIPLSVLLMGFLLVVIAYTVWQSFSAMRAGNSPDD